MSSKIENTLQSEYEICRKKIDSLIKELRKSITSCNPLEILKYGYDRFIQSSGGVAAEINLSGKDIYMARELEYIQSVLVSAEYEREKNIELNINYEEISNKILELHMLINQSFIYKVKFEVEKDKIDIDSDIEMFLMEAQNNMFIRGDRYQIYEIEHLKDLLEIHSNEFMKLYGITTDEFIEGIQKIQYSLLNFKNTMLSMCGNDEFLKLFKLLEENKSFLEENTDFDEAKIIEQFNNLKVDKYEMFNLTKVTNLPKELLADLAYKLGGNKKFYEGEFGGYPIIELPVFDKPFIEIEGEYYCFDYYNLFDNLYRALQRVIREKDSEYKDKWMKNQMVATENLVEKIFAKLLPQANIYTSNYYPQRESLKNCNENDMIVVYENNLIIIEVKAGAYSYRAPILDIESHIKSLKTLVEKAGGQAQRTLEYLQKNKKAKLYDINKKEKCEIKIDDFDEITLMCVTLDNFNEFCAKIEKIQFLNMNKDTIAISIDDLRVYRDYFETSIEFLHYLKQRKIATENKNLYFNDELDHLGMYIEGIHYSRSLGKKDEKIYAYGYREELDEYFGSLMNPEWSIEKPKRELPKYVQDIIIQIEKTPPKNNFKLGEMILDLNLESLEEFDRGIQEVLVKQKELGRMLQILLGGETGISFFCHQDNILNMTQKDRREHTLINMIGYDEESRAELTMFFDTKKELQEIKFNIYDKKDILSDEFAILEGKAKLIFENRINRQKQFIGSNKIGRNDPCPCGSRKKYKKCHGK